VKFIFLTNRFYIDYSHCSEIEQKRERPYAQIYIECNGVNFAIPFRSNIKHSYAYWTDKENRAGIDYTKAVVLENDKYIDTTAVPYIRPNEFKALLGKNYNVVTGMAKYIARYKKAKEFPHRPENTRLLKYSTLQYFENYI